MLTALLGAQLLEEAGFPPDLWQVVAGPGAQVGTAIIERADYICFTGSTATGKLIAAAVRRAAHRLLARARRQEPDPGPARRRPREGRRGRGPGVVLQRRPALRLDGADVRRRPGLRPVRRAVRGPHRGDDARRQPRLGRRHGLADLPGPARHRHRPRRGRRGQGRPGAHRRPGPPRPRPVLLRADHPRGRHPRHDLLRQRDLRAGHLALPLPRRGRRDRARQRGRVRPERLDLQPGRPPGPGDRPPDQVRHRQHQRGVRRDVRQHRLPDGRHARVRHGPPPGQRGHPPLHRVPVGRHPAR